MSKGNKSKRPISKKVQLLNEQLARRQGVRKLAKRFLIVCEDNKSAPNYFHALKRHFKLSAASIEVVGSGGNTQPIQVVEHAVEIQTRASDSEGGTEPFEEVWCVIDGDYGNKINNARKKANANKVKLAISTKCFEYWVLLHFEENNTPTIKCDELISTLRRRCLPGYDKGTCKFDDIMKSVNIACERAGKLRKPGIERGENPEDHNPCSEVYKLVNAILDA